MTGQGRSPVFLERRSYRRRRVMDALRILPVVGVFLWLVPLFWPTGQGGPGAPEPMSMSHAVIYVFAVWLVLIGAAFVLWWVLRPGSDTGDDTSLRTDL